MRETDTARIGVVALLVLSAVVVAGAFATGAAADGYDDAPADARANATPIHEGEQLTVTTDHDEWFKLDATRGESFVVEAKLNDSTVSTVDRDNIRLHVYDPSGRRIGEASGAGSVKSRVEYGDNWATGADVATTNGTYYVRVAARNPGESRQYNLTLRTYDLDRYDPNEDAGNATQLSPNATIEARSGAYDHDYYAVDLDAGDELVLGDGDDDPKTVHGGMEVYAPNGERVRPEQDEYPSASFTANETGTYVIALGGTVDNLPNLDDEPYDYTLDLQRYPASTSPADGADDAGDSDEGNETDDSGTPDVDDGC